MVDERFSTLPPWPKVAFVGSASESAVVLASLLEAGIEPLVVLCGPPARRGRGGRVTLNEVEVLASSKGISVVHRQEELLGFQAELGVVVAYGRILRAAALAWAPMVNVHFSLLPRWRGAAPVERALLAGDSVTGVCLMEVSAGLDEGAVFARRELPIVPADTAKSLRSELSVAGAELLLEALKAGANGFANPQAQTGEVTYASKLDPAELRVDFSAPAAYALRQIAVGGAWCRWQDKRIKLLRAHQAEAQGLDELTPGLVEGNLVACGEGMLAVDALQPEGKKPMEFAAWRRGIPQDALVRFE